MNIDDALIEMFRLLEKHNVYPSKQFMRDIKSLVKTDIKKLIWFKHRKSNKDIWAKIN